ncbi:MAG TPA: thiol reductant ABC exporter subunit CydC [Marinobacter sp.]|nr:thiol reductant ABC exporter subunit CydC [Marinobacter sp.]
MINTLRPWLRLIFQRRNRLLIGALLILLTLLSGMALLALSGWFITKTALVGLLIAMGVQASIELYLPGSAIRLFAVSRTVFRYLERIYNHETVLRLLADIRVTLFKRLALVPRSQRSPITGAQWLSRLLTDVDALDTLHLRLLAPAALAALVSVGVIVLAVVVFSVQTGVFVAVCLGLSFAVATGAVYLRTQRLAQAQSERQDALRSQLIQHIEGYAELTAAGRARNHSALLMQQAEQLTGEQCSIETRAGWHLAGSGLLINLAVVVALWMGFSLYQQQMLSGPVLVLLPIALLGLGEVYGMLPDAFARLGGTVASARRLNRDAGEPAGHGDVTLAKTTGLKAPENSDLAVAVYNLQLRHGHGQPLLAHPLTIELKPGQWLGFTGRSGSGKSSLADALSGLIQPSSGSVSSLPVAYLTQQTYLFDDTLRMNLQLANSQATDAELWQVLDLVEMGDRFADEPAQLDTWLGSGGNVLSGGEARRIALARVLLSPACVLVLDEPFTGIDNALRDRIRDRLKQRLAGRTVISLAHSVDALADGAHTIALYE